MPSTEHDPQEARLREFFHEHLVPAASRLRERGVRFFPLGPEPDAESYYLSHPTDGDFEEIDPAGAEARLEELWQAQGSPELSELAGPLTRLAEMLFAEEAQEGSTELSSFIYVMY